MKSPAWLFAALAALAACRASTSPARNSLPRHQPLTETTIPENAEPTRRAGLALPDSSRRALPEHP
ncbi:hypothetical protein IC235_03570 [Hymenobacter sp. BT664]|uniref:Uncharacterized protein n=1 Tax=Hymenobacter montanus TaxID=2771359 RepID=A0A927BA56_9BACT|nr:hypothetical protein [Hymenobacter montanus]MBD2766970.1 hypothetical protein [Hymenobacter montanus]